MTEYSYRIQYGKPKFFKNGEHMTDSEILNEMEVKEILLKQWIDEANRLSDENTRIKHTIKEAYETERTAIGQSVLRQILEQIK